MLRKPIFVLLAIGLLAASPTQAARRSRIDTPIANPAEAPPGDNLAMESNDAPDNKVEVPASQPPSGYSSTESSDLVEVSQSTSASSITAASSADKLTDVNGATGEIEEECDPDMVGFEIITG